ncbi:flagellar biosynthesis protein [Paenibacillus thermoaerophilus]|nr:flagellar biosynthesis protein [Paenibacillus thermoaerophilus]
MNERLAFPSALSRPIPPAGTSSASTGKIAAGQPPAGDFKSILRDRMLRISHHAESRMKQRGIEFSAEDWSKLSHAVDKAKEKGAKDSLVLMKGMALIVNVPNRTVVTAMEQASMNNPVFTQIDSAVILN